MIAFLTLLVGLFIGFVGGIFLCTYEIIAGSNRFRQYVIDTCYDYMKIEVVKES